VETAIQLLESFSPTKEKIMERRIKNVVGAIALLFLAVPVAAAADGDLDPAFGIGGMVLTDFNNSTDLGNAVALQSDGKLIVAGMTYTNNDFSGEDFAIARYKPDGTLDMTFGTNGKVTTDFPGLAAVISAVVVQPDGKIVVAGGAFPLFTFAGDFKIARYNPNGSLDTSFGNGGVVTTVFPGDGSYAFTLALQSDGKIVAAGTDFVDFHPGDQSNTDFALARYNPDGSPDTTFGNGGTVTTDFLGQEDDVYSVLIQPDGKIVAVGSANSPIDYYNFAAARYLPNGTLDSTFGTGGKVRTDFGNNDLDIAYAAALQPDGKIVAAGTTVFDFGVQQQFALVRYNSNGTLDTTFDTDGRLLIDFGSYAQSANSVLVQPDGKIVSVGYPDTESDDSDFLLARCNANGSLDSSFGVGGKVRTSFGDLNGGANGAVLQPDGKIVAAGFQATQTDTNVDFALARYLGTPASLQMTSAVSRKSHGSAGNFDVNLPMSGQPGVECRTGGINGNYTLVFSFNNNLVSGSASVTSGTGTVSGTPTVSGHTLTVNLTGVANAQIITVTLSNVIDEFSHVLPDTPVSMNVLLGDTTGNGTINASDVAQAKSQIGQPVTGGNFRVDVNVNGAINGTDVALIKSRSG
jgi:uncharacterized delta-60 repeat protein